MSGRTVLVAEDDAGIRTVLVHALTRGKLTVNAFASVRELIGAVKGGEGDLVITDVVLPDGSGLDATAQIKSMRPDLPVIVMSAQNTFMTAISATEKGAYEYLPKPFDIDELVALVNRGLAERQESAAVPAEPSDVPLVGRSPAMQDVYRVLARVMQTDLTVLVSGESGTGKELVARALHDYGARRSRAFVAVNMAAIPRDLIEAELFGHEKGAFTGASARTSGRFEQAEGGTLFLDEIGDMPMEAQTRLLRVLQENEYTTVGGRRLIRADVRIVAATNQDLPALIDAGRFREDLYYRLNVVPIRLPSLRERRQDIGELVQHFLDRAVASGLPRRSFDRDAISALESHGWPGNVRELENMVRRLVVLSIDDVIGGDLVRRELGSSGADTSRNESATDLETLVARYVADAFGAEGGTPDQLHATIIAKVERPLIAAVLSEVGGNQLRAAAILGLNRNTLRKRIRELDVKLPMRRNALK